MTKGKEKYYSNILIFKKLLSEVNETFHADAGLGLGKVRSY